MLSLKRGICLVGLWLTAVMMTTGALHANDGVPILNPGLYRLQNHPDGNAAPPLYGLRTDELINATGGHDIFTYDFEAPGAAMFLDLTPTTARIFGTAFGGLNSGSGYDPSLSGFWSIDFTYNDLMSLVPGDNDYVDNTDGQRGTITQLFGAGTTFDLFSYRGFRLGDGGNDLGHRGFAGVSGWGWLAYRSGHVNATDWLFTVDPVAVPEPGTYLTLGAFLSMVLLMSARRRAAHSRVS